MAQNSKNKNTLKNLPFYSEEIESSKKSNKKISNISLLSELPFFDKKTKDLCNKELSEALPFFPEKQRKKRPKRLTKYQILQNVLPFFYSVGISRSGHTKKYFAETYDVEVIDNKSLDDSLF